MSRTARAARIGACAALLISTSARAEEVDVAAAPPHGGVESITVRGRRVESLSLSLPAGGEEIGAERIARLPALSAAGIVAYLPGIRVQQRVQGEDAAVSIDGLPPEYSKLLLNGQRYAGEIGGVGDLSDLPIAGVERIEVLRGPQALRYGADAAGGVVNVVTQPAPSDPGARLQLDTRMGEQGLVHATHSGGARAGNLGATWNLLHDQIDGFDSRGSDAVAVSANSDSRRRLEDAYATFDYALGEDARLISDLGWRFEREDLVFDEGESAHRRDYGRHLASFGAERWIGPDSLAHARVRAFDAQTESAVGRAFDMGEREWSIDSGLEHGLRLLGADHTLELGFDLEAPGIELDESALSAAELEGVVEDIDPALLVPSSTDESFTLAGLSARWEAPLSRWATFELGLRSQLHSAFADRVLPQTALLLTPNDALRLRLGWGLGYRTPSLRELYQPPVTQNGGAYFLSGNPELGAESTSGWRLGAEYEPDPRVELGATFFANRLEDHIRSVHAGQVLLGTRVVTRTRPTNDPFCANLPPGHPRCTIVEQVREPVEANLFRKANLDRVRTRGLEARVLLHPISDLSLRLGYTLLRTSVHSNLIGADELPNEPRHTLDFEAMYQLPRLDTELALRARWRDESIPERSGTGLGSFVDPTSRTDRSWLLDFRLLQPLRDSLELYVDVLNLTNEDSVDSYEIRPRMLIVGMKLDFEDLRWAR
jgi:outer membrane receptor for ferrienterochelin and colicins